MKAARNAIIGYLGLVAFLLMLSVFFLALDYTHPTFTGPFENKFSHILDWAGFFFFTYQLFRGMRILDKANALLEDTGGDSQD